MIRNYSTIFSTDHINPQQISLLSVFQIQWISQNGSFQRSPLALAIVELYSNLIHHSRYMKLLVKDYNNFHQLFIRIHFNFLQEKSLLFHQILDGLYMFAEMLLKLLGIHIYPCIIIMISLQWKLFKLIFHIFDKHIIISIFHHIIKC